MRRIIFIPLLVPFLFFIITCKKGKDTSSATKAYVSAKGGLRMRTQPDLNAGKVVTVPDGSEVQVLEEKGESITLAGATGKWTKVKWTDKTGWVFGGFLADEKTLNKNNADIKDLFYKAEFSSNVIYLNIRKSKNDRVLREGEFGLSGCLLTELGSENDYKFTNDSFVFNVKVTNGEPIEDNSGSVVDCKNSTINTFQCTIKRTQLEEIIGTKDNHIDIKCNAPNF